MELTEPFLDITLNALYGDADWGQKGFRREYLERVQSLIKLFSIRIREAQNDKAKSEDVGHVPVELTDRQLDVLIQACHWDLSYYGHEYEYDYKRVLGITINIYEKAKASLAAEAREFDRQIRDATREAIPVIERVKRKRRKRTLDDFIEGDDYLDGIY